MSDRYRFYVVPSRNLLSLDWEVKAQDPGAPEAVRVQTLPTQAEAIDYAVAVAKEICASGSLAQVHVERESGRFRTEWTYGKGPPEYPG